MSMVVYIIARKGPISFTGPVKVGVSNNVKSRLATIQTATPYPVGIYATFPVPNRDIAIALEFGFHTVMKAARKQGEWFDMTPEEARVSMLENIHAFFKLHLEFDEAEIIELMKIYTPNGED